MWKEVIAMKMDGSDVFNIERQNEAARNAWKELLASQERKSPIFHHVSRKSAMMESRLLVYY
jgi:hypothetical protein